MNNELRPYDEYKTSQNRFLKKIPNKWTEYRFHSLVNLKSLTNNTGEELLSVFLNKGVIKYSETSKMQVHKPSEDMSKYQLVNHGDLVLNNQQAWRGSVGISKYRGVVSPAYYVFKLSGIIDIKFGNYMFRNSAMIDQFVLASKGVGTIQRNLYYPYLKNAIITLPTIEEQDKIVKYLDFQITKINKFIKAKKKLIAALKEQKQAVINEAVTKGINPNVKMKPSDIAWLGDIPAHWKCGKIKNHAKLSPSKGKEFYKSNLNDKVVFLPMEKISIYGDIDNSDKRIINEVKNGFTYFEKDDVVVAKITPCFENGKGACLDKLKSNFGFGTTELIVLRANKYMLPQYLYLITRTSYFRILGAEVMTGSAGQKRIPTEFISNFSLGIPDIIEQEKIIDFIYKRIYKIEQSVVGVEKEINLITEYCTSLISDVVTGKVDVRNIVIDDILYKEVEIYETEDENIESEEDIEIGESDE